MNRIIAEISRIIWGIDKKKPYFDRLVAGFRSAAWPELKSEIEETILVLYAGYDKCETHMEFKTNQAQIKALSRILEIENVEVMASISAKRQKQTGGLNG